MRHVHMSEHILNFMQRSPLLSLTDITTRFTNIITAENGLFYSSAKL
jgi:hypothetical protein